MILKFIILFFTLVTFVSGKSIEHAMDRCFNETGTTQEELYEVESRKPFTTDKRNVKCFYKCFLYGITLMDDDGTLLEKAKDPSFGITEDDLKDFVHCLNVTGATLCDKAFNFVKCTVEENNDIWSW